MIELDDGFFADPWAVAVVKRASKGKCVLYTRGQSALEGFVLDREALQVAQEIVDAKYEDEGSEEDADNA